MARTLADFFSPKALSCKAFFKKFPRGPYRYKIGDADLQEVKKGSDKLFALFLEGPDVWIVCNQTNANRLRDKWNDNIDEWVGKKVTLSKQATGYQGQDGFLITPS